MKIPVYKPWGAFWALYSREHGVDNLVGTYVTLREACERGSKFYG